MTLVAEAPETIFSLDWKHPDYDPIFRSRIERLQRLREKPELIPQIKAYYKDNFPQFINDWGCTYDPRNVEIGLPATVPFILFPRQVEYLDWLKARWQARENGLVEKSRDMGVSWLSVAFAVCVWLFYPGTVVGFGSRKEMYVDELSDPKSLFWKIRKLVELLPAEFRPAGYDAKRHATYMKLVNPENEAVIAGEAGDNIGRGARASIYLVDEAAFIEHQETVDAALSQTTNCKIDISTPNGVGNAFYRKRKGGKIPVFVFDWHDDPRKSQTWYDKQAETLDPVTVAAEIDRSYEASVGNAFIPGDLVRTAMRRGPADIRPSGRLRVGVDVARFGDDKSCIVFRRGRVVLKVVRFGKSEIPATAARVYQELRAFNEAPEQIAVDTVGYGAGVADILRGWFPDAVHPLTLKRKRTVVDVESGSRMADGKNYNLRAFMWSEMKEWLVGASLPNDPDLETDLTGLQYGFRAGGELLLESKDDAKKRGIKSPDSADALALTFAVPTIPDVPRQIMPSTAMPADPSCGHLG
jgi:hypothetical protein